MNAFDNIIGKRIVNIQRLDSDADYEFFSPYSIIFSLDNQTEKLILSATNDGSSVDIKLTNDNQIEIDYGLEFSEHTLNDLKTEDHLNLLIAETIETIRIAEFNLPEIPGSGFVIKQGKYAGIELTTKSHRLLFQNKNGGWYDMDVDKTDLSKRDRWQWK